MNQEPSEIDSWLRKDRQPNVTVNQEEVKSEQCIQLHKERAGIQAAFTRAENKLNELLADENSKIITIEDTVNSLERFFENLNLKVIQIQECCSEEEGGRLELYKSEIFERLHKVRGDVQARQQDLVKPGDSASQVGSSTSSTRSKVAAKQAALKVKQQALKKSQDLKLKRIQIEMEEENHNLETEVAIADAEMKAIEEVSGVQVNTSRCARARNNSPPKVEETKKNGETQSRKPAGRLNPEALPWTGQGYANPINPEVQLESINTLQMLQLPKVEIMSFDGNPLKYWAFVRSFDNSIGQTLISDSAKLNRLVHYCVGPAKEVIECCLIMDEEHGYNKARQLLLERFGNHHIIAKAWIDRVTDGPNLRPNDCTSMRKYADTIRSCVVSLSAMGKLSEIDNQLRMKRIIDKLPVYIQNSWRKEAVNTLRHTGSYPGIDQLARFIENIAEEMADPVFGVNVKDSIERTSQRRDFKFRPTSNFAADVNQDNRDNAERKTKSSCKCCGDSHPLFLCQAFKKLDVKRRLEQVIKHKLCFNCFSSMHMLPDCRKENFCDVDRCKQLGKKHSNLLHDHSRTYVKGREHLNNKPPAKSENQQPPDFNHNDTTLVKGAAYGANGAGGKRIALPIVPVCVKGHKTFALLDPGSTNSFCSEELADCLRLEGKTATLSLNTLTDRNSESTTRVVSLNMTDIEGKNSVNMSNVFVLPQMPLVEGSVVTQSDIDNWEHFRGIDLPIFNGPLAKVTILIGQDNPSALIPLDVRSGTANQPYATKTILGWAINGPLQRGPQKHVTANFVQENLDAQVERFWRLNDAINDDVTYSFQDKHVINLWDASVDREDDHYKLPIPFKSNPPGLPNNYSAAHSRLQSLTRKLMRDDKLSQDYNAGMRDMLQKGYAEKVPSEETNETNGFVWYLPHHVVINDKKPGKFRIVFDCSAAYNDTSLNKAVYQGPDLTNSLLGVLLRFRQHEIALAGDIESMYHRVKVTDPHRDSLRFLWWKDEIVGGEVEIYRMTSHLFGGIWSSSCANYALQKVALDNINNFDYDVIQTVKDNFYVDDCLKSVKSEQEGVKLIKELCELLQRGSFRLTKWLSNSRTVLSNLPKEERAKNLKDVDLGTADLPQDKALGVKWDTETDELCFKFSPKSKPLTKRGLMSVIASIYDPLGFLAPVILSAKQIFQDECRLHKGWDVEMEPYNKEKWSKWLSELNLIEGFSTPRCVVPGDFNEGSTFELQIFADASSVGYGAVTYLRMRNTKGQICCSFLMSKSRLSPIKTITIPRLELCAAVLAVRLNELLRKELRINIERTVFWTDSMIVLHYIRNESQRYQVFVANRVTVIRERSLPENWRHVESSLNPADIVSRGLDASALLKQESWLQGPSFLWQNEDTWPNQPPALNIATEKLEIKKAKVNFAKTEDVDFSTDRLLQKYSSWYGLKKAVCWILRLKRCLICRVKQKQGKAKVSMEPLSVAEMKESEKAIIKYVQKSSFPKEIECLIGARSIKQSSPIRPLEPFLNEDGILCVGGRLAYAPIPEETRHPMILPKGHEIVTVIARDCHEQLGHSGTEHVLSHIRTRFWVINARASIKKVLRDCIRCRRLQGKQLVQKMSDLPKDRVTPGAPPFSHVGVDCFGPFIVKRGRSQVKRYGCLFTCLTTRAIHIEKLDSLDTDSFINGLKRFEARRGPPVLIRSDNGTNFRGAEKELRQAINAWNQQSIQEHMRRKDITWMFNPPAASHMGGVWERQIRTVRKVLNALLYQQHNLQDEGLTTLLCEVESIVNSRPITVNSDDHKDMEPLTPNHILLLRSPKSAPPGRFSLSDRYGKRWKYIQSLADQFWARWLKEYLPTLQLRQKWLGSTVNLKVGDIVLIMHENVPRYMVTQVNPGNDGLVRSVMVRTKNSELTRPIHKLCLLEGVCQGQY